MREGLTLAVHSARADGAAEGTREAARAARHEPVRATALPTDALAEARATYRRAAFARAHDEMFADHDVTRER
jgi:hypothetical protein